MEEMIPVYYFDVHGSEGSVRDEFGQDLADDDEAQDQAVALLPDLMRDEPSVDPARRIMCEVRGEAGRLVCRATLSLLTERVSELTGIWRAVG